MINERLVDTWIKTAKNISPEAGIPDRPTSRLALKVVLEELFEQAEACGRDTLHDLVADARAYADKWETKANGTEPLNEGVIALRDAIADTFVTACNMPVYAGLIDVCESDFEEVMRSNFTKFCRTQEEATVSVEKYTASGRNTIFKKQGDYFVILDADTGKILKGIHYEEPRLL